MSVCCVCGSCGFSGSHDLTSRFVIGFDVFDFGGGFDSIC